MTQPQAQQRSLVDDLRHVNLQLEVLALIIERVVEAEKVMQGHAVMARERDIQEVNNYRRVIEYIDQNKT